MINDILAVGWGGGGVNGELKVTQLKQRIIMDE